MNFQSYIIFFLLIINQAASSQNISANVKWLGSDSIEFNITFSKINIVGDSLLFLLPMNGYQNSKTKLALTLLGTNDDYLYFETDTNAFGGYKKLICTIDGKIVNPAYDLYKEEALVLNVKGSSINWSGLIKLPNYNTENEYRNKDAIILDSWLPSIKDQGNQVMAFEMSLPNTYQAFFTEPISHEVHTQEIIYYGSIYNESQIAIVNPAISPIDFIDNHGQSYRIYLNKYQASRKSRHKILTQLVKTYSSQMQHIKNQPYIIIPSKFENFYEGLAFIDIAKAYDKQLDINFYPTYRYMDKGIHLYGLKYKFKREKINFFINPYISNDKAILGEAAFSYKFPIKDGLVNSIESIFSIRRFNHFKFENGIARSYNLLYEKFYPNIIFHFNETRRKSNSMQIGFASINEQQAKGFDTNLEIVNNNQKLYKLQYNREIDKNVFNSNTSIRIDHFRYETQLNDQKQFTKITTDYFSSWRFSKSRYFNLRLFASYFLQNNERKSQSYSNEVVKGSIALIHQGFNDFAFEEYYAARSNQEGIFINQIGTNGGGFKNASTNKSSLGESNDYAFALNSYYQMYSWNNVLMFSPYFDMGAYKQNKLKYIYSAGLVLNFKNMLFLYLPIINHKDINSNYADRKYNLFERLSFKVTAQHYFYDKM